MKVTAYKTHKVSINEDIFTILDQYLPALKENSVVAIASKIIAFCQGDVVKKERGIEKRDLIPQEADYYLGDEYHMQFGQIISIKNHTLTASAGIDESNANGYLILWPKNLQEITDKIWNYLKEKHTIKNLGVIVTDSRIVPLRWGVIGIALSWCGFEALKDYTGKPDIFGRIMRVEKTSLIDSLATAATVVTGEGGEQQPIAVIEDLDFVKFQNRTPTEEEIKKLQIDFKDDLFEPLLTSVKWKKGGKE
jgi:dihydrofolate synthase / folylpolyglutamate synthase